MVMLTCRLSGPQGFAWISAVSEIFDRSMDAPNAVMESRAPKDL